MMHMQANGNKGGNSVRADNDRAKGPNPEYKIKALQALHDAPPLRLHQAK